MLNDICLSTSFYIRSKYSKAKRCYFESIPKCTWNLWRQNLWKNYESTWISKDEWKNYVLELNEKKIKLISLKENIDTTNESGFGKFLLDLLLALTAFELDTLRERENELKNLLKDQVKDQVYI